MNIFLVRIRNILIALLGSITVLILGLLFILTTSPNLRRDICQKLLSDSSTNVALDSIVIKWNEIQLKNFFIEKNKNQISGENFICEISFIDLLLFSEINIQKLEASSLDIQIQSTPQHEKSLKKTVPIEFNLPKLTIQSMRADGKIALENTASATFTAVAKNIQPTKEGQFTITIKGTSTAINNFQTSCSGSVRQSNNAIDLLVTQESQLTFLGTPTLKDCDILNIVGKLNARINSNGTLINESFIKIRNHQSNELINAKNLQSIHIPWETSIEDLFKKQGPLIEFTIQDLPLSYFNVWTPPYELNGRIKSFQSIISAHASAFRLETPQGFLLQDFFISGLGESSMPALSAEIQLGLSVEPILQKRLKIDTIHLDQLILQLKNSQNDLILNTQLLKPVAISTQTPTDFLKHNGNLLSLEINHLPLAWLNFWTKPLELKGHLKGLEGSLGVDNGILKWASTTPLQAEALQVTKQNSKLLEKCNCSVMPLIEVNENSLKCALNELSFFDNSRSCLLKGQTSLLIEKQKGLSELSGHLTLDLPGLCRQPLAQSLFSISSGTLSGGFSMNAIDQHTRNFNCDLSLSNLQSTKPLQLPKTIRATTSGTAIDQNFNTSTQVSIDATEGKTQLDGTIDYQGSVYACSLSSPNVYLDSLLGFSGLGQNAIPSIPPSKPITSETPLWKGVPTIALKLEIENIIYEKNPAIQKLKGRMRIDEAGFILESLTGTAFDSPFEASGSLKCDQIKQSPYALASDFKCTKLNSGKIFTQFKRGTPSPIEGLFDAKGKIHGEGATMDDLQKNIQGKFTLESQKGCLKVLDAAGQKAQLGTAALGVASIFLGQNRGSSLDTASELITLLKQIDYDTCNVVLERGASKNLNLETFKVVGPTLLLEAKGQVTNVPNLAFLDQPLVVNGHLGAAGEAAALMNRLQLLEGKELQNGYRKGPSFSIGGTLAKPDFSNLYGLITKAGKSLLAGDKKEAPVEPASKTEQTVNAIGSVLKGLIGR